MGQEELIGDASTVAAISTPRGAGGIAVIRMSGPHSKTILARVWKGANPYTFKSHTVHLGWIADSEGKDIDQVTATYFQAPNSYTGEEVMEISCHGSPWVQQAILNTLVENGAAVAPAGEFTRRAFINGRLDLAQAEGVADMIAASSRAAGKLAASRLKGDYSRRLEALRSRLVELGVLLELELDFSEEDVEFADRSKLIEIASELQKVVGRLVDSFKTGKAFKEGVPVAIAGIPNAGKSTLLNYLLGDDKAIVSNIPGTTRDFIEDTAEIEGVLFRFIDTAGLRESDDEIERMGVGRTRKKVEEASIVLYLLDPTQDVARQLAVMSGLKLSPEAKRIVVSTKSDITGSESDGQSVAISVKGETGLDELKRRIVEAAKGDFDIEGELLVTNTRHFEALSKALQPLRRLLDGLRDGVSADFLAQDLRETDRYLGEITGAVTSDEILHTIFSRFCIGK